MTVPAGTTWSAQFTAAWPGEHRVVVTEGGSKDQAALSVTAVATYLSAVSGRLTAADVRYSYRPGCPVAPSQLRRLTITYWDWHGRPRTGQVIARAGAVRDLRAVFRVAFRTRFPLRSVTPVDEYYADGRRTSARSDIATMAADNTSAFNCRRVTGNRHRISPHAYGTAIDLNPFENPYVTHRRYYPHGAKKYLNRSKARKACCCAAPGREGLPAARLAVGRAVRETGLPALRHALSRTPRGLAAPAAGRPDDQERRHDDGDAEDEHRDERPGTGQEPAQQPRHPGVVGGVAGRRRPPRPSSIRLRSSQRSSGMVAYGTTAVAATSTVRPAGQRWLTPTSTAVMA